MKFERTQGAPVETRCDLLAVAVFDDQLREGDVIQALDKKLDGLLLRLFDDEQFKAKKNQTLLVHTHGKLGGQRLLLVGCGPRADFQPSDLRGLGGRAAKTARTVGAKSVALAWPAGLDDDRATQMASEGVLLGRYRFDRYHTDENRRQDLAVDSIDEENAAEEAAARDKHTVDFRA